MKNFTSEIEYNEMVEELENAFNNMTEEIAQLQKEFDDVHVRMNRDTGEYECDCNEDWFDSTYNILDDAKDIDINSVLFGWEESDADEFKALMDRIELIECDAHESLSGD